MSEYDASVSADRSCSYRPGVAGTRFGSYSMVRPSVATRLRYCRQRLSPAVAACNPLLHPVSYEREHLLHRHSQHEYDGGGDGGGGDGDGVGDFAGDVSSRITPKPIKRCQIASYGRGSPCDDGGGVAFGDCFPCVMKKLL